MSRTQWWLVIHPFRSTRCPSWWLRPRTFGRVGTHSCILYHSSGVPLPCVCAEMRRKLSDSHDIYSQINEIRRIQTNKNIRLAFFFYFYRVMVCIWIVNTFLHKLVHICTVNVHSSAQSSYQTYSTASWTENTQWQPNSQSSWLKKRCSNQNLS